MTEQKSNEIPSSSRVWESAVLDHGIEQVWAAVRGCDFKFAGNVKSVDLGDFSTNCVSGTRVITYTDGTKQTVQIVELSDLHHFVTFRLIASDPSVSYTSAVHSIKLRDVTFTKDNKARTFIEWTSDFSNDAKVGVIEDSRYKKREAFKDLDKSFNKS